jgi:hypothetical protein
VRRRPADLAREVIAGEGQIAHEDNRQFTFNLPTHYLCFMPVLAA